MVSNTAPTYSYTHKWGSYCTVELYIKSWPLPSLRDFGNVGVHLVMYQQQQQQLGLSQAHS